MELKELTEKVIEIFEVDEAHNLTESVRDAVMTKLLDERKNLNLDIDLLKEKVERNPKAIDVDLINDIQRDLAIISELNTVVRILKELGSAKPNPIR